MFTHRLRKVLLFSLSGVALSLAATAAAQYQTRIKMVLNWKYQGPQGIFFLAEDLGYFKAENLEVTIDQGNGSGAAVPLVANGTYDAGFGDINALIELAAKKPGDAPLAVYVIFNQPPFTIAVKADSSIKTPRDLVGKTLGGAPNDSALKRLAHDHPDAVKGFVRAIDRGLIAALKDPAAAIEAVAKRELLIERDVERAHYDATLKAEMNHPEIARIGLGNVDPNRLKRSIDLLVGIDALPRTPTPDEIFTPAFLPPHPDLVTKLF